MKDDAKRDTGSVARLVALGREAEGGGAEAKAQAMFANDKLRENLERAKAAAEIAEAPRPAPASEASVATTIDAPIAPADRVAPPPRVMVSPRASSLHATTEVVAPRRAEGRRWTELALAAAAGTLVGAVGVIAFALGFGPDPTNAPSATSAAAATARSAPPPPARAASECPPAPAVSCAPCAPAPSAIDVAPDRRSHPSAPPPASPPRPPTRPTAPSPPSTAAPVLE